MITNHRAVDGVGAFEPRMSLNCNNYRSGFDNTVFLATLISYEIKTTFWSAESRVSCEQRMVRGRKF